MTQLLEIPVEKIRPNPEQPRLEFDSAEIASLAESIKEHGLLQPIAVEERGGEYVLIDGERRLRAVKLLKLGVIQAVVNGDGISPEKQAVLALVANLQRADLNAVEEGRAYKRLISEYNLSRLELSRKIGKPLSYITLRLKILEMEKPIQDLIGQGKLPKDQRFLDAIKTVPEGPIRIKLSQQLAERGASVKACMEACQRANEHIQAETIAEDEVPSFKLQRIKTGDVNRPIYDALAAVGRVPPWLLVELSSKTVCERCSLRDTASITICKGCALVEFLIEMVGRVQK